MELRETFDDIEETIAAPLDSSPVSKYSNSMIDRIVIAMQRTVDTEAPIRWV